jgi:hypothetical protein
MLIDNELRKAMNKSVGWGFGGRATYRQSVSHLISKPFPVDELAGMPD